MPFESVGLSATATAPRTFAASADATIRSLLLPVTPSGFADLVAYLRR